ncbi:o-succinylbenzoate synthase [Demequina zhanjiangensis]|uniref:o-succinylbenzoate synthase n=1 Tax=Demequina zhanjiangensis TaxID=3051659 RepID=A0ABT8G3S4_9MICO|nr:o-succinylbenzoate synthase [Demequina sp. SYSU T00b26]MDN4473780.1 o-succinylbenzoate synthase [Demequina sp. SYSU T00b26]
MKITHVALRTLELPLVAPFTTSFSTQTHRRVIVLELHAEVDGVEVIGWGECGALPEPVYNEEYNAGVLDVTTTYLLPMLAEAQRKAPLTAESIAHHLERIVGNRMAKAAVEMAVLDAQLRAAGTSFADYLGVTKDRVPSGVSIGIQNSVPQLLETVQGYLDEGYVRIKLKIKPGWDIDPVRAVREAHPDIPLQVDANAAYTLVDANHLAKLDAYDVLLIEQPLAEDDMRQHAELAKRMRTPMCLDESVVSAPKAADAIAMGAAQIINIKPSRVGGYLEARRIHDIASAHGIAVWCGGMLETGIGRAANAALAGMPGFTLPGDISASDRFYAEDITDPFVIEDGYLAIPREPGLARVPDAGRLEAATVGTLHVDL